MGQIREIREHYLAKWPQLLEYIKERPNVKCYGLIVEEDVEAVMLMSHNRIYHIHVNHESRNGGYGSKMISFAIANYDFKSGPLTCAVAPDNKEAVLAFLKMGFRIVGFEVSWGDNRYNMHYNADWEFKGEDPDQLMKESLESMANYLYVIEALPVLKIK